uniref:Uncharacterized protein n=1 Tax=Zeugodacus cucurbitae TaxID=28588 RepID=A0A0A1WTU6_ZEUCU
MIEVDPEITKPLNLANSAVLRAVEEEEQMKCGYKRVAWPPVSEERVVREFTPQPTSAHYPVSGSLPQQPAQQQQPQHLQQQQQPLQQQQQQQQQAQQQTVGPPQAQPHWKLAAMNGYSPASLNSSARSRGPFVTHVTIRDQSSAAIATQPTYQTVQKQQPQFASAVVSGGAQPHASKV